MRNQSPDIPESDDDPTLAGLPDWFVSREVIPLDDHLALVVCHETMHEIVNVCRSLADSRAPVLLTGETGVGKSLLARFIHASRDPYAPFVSMTTAGLGEDIILATVFGEGTAQAEAQPLAAQAAGGTLVLEEMGDLPHAVQKRLIRAWSQAVPGKTEGEKSGSAPPHSPAQWILTTNLPHNQHRTPGATVPGFLKAMRHIHVPPLRERKEDIPAITAYFSRIKSSREASLESLEDLAKRLSRHEFPGNVRELESIVSLDAGGLAWEWRNSGSGINVCLATKKKK